MQGLDGAFAVFPLIHATVSDLARLRRVVIEAIEDFHADNVVYLGMRRCYVRVRFRTLIFVQSFALLLAPWALTRKPTTSSTFLSCHGTQQPFLSLVRCVVAAMSECMQRPDLSGIAVRFLISIDRSKCIDDARDAIKVRERLWLNCFLIRHSVP